LVPGGHLTGLSSESTSNRLTDEEIRADPQQRACKTRSDSLKGKLGRFKKSLTG
jgi:DNA-directed RNA polymerase beta' subunit